MSQRMYYYGTRHPSHPMNSSHEPFLRLSETKSERLIMFSASGDGSEKCSLCTSAFQSADCVLLTHGSSIRGIGYMQNMRAFKTVCPLRNQLHLDITTAIKVQKTEVFVLFCFLQL